MGELVPLFLTREAIRHASLLLFGLPHEADEACLFLSQIKEVLFNPLNAHVFLPQLPERRLVEVEKLGFVRSAGLLKSLDLP